jgi:hypothetical protein
MHKEARQLDYHVERTRRRHGRLGFGLGLAVATISLFGIRMLGTMPYRPPYDMSTFLGAPELAIVRTIMWCSPSSGACC